MAFELSPKGSEERDEMGNSILGEVSAKSEAPSRDRLGFLWCGRHTVLSLEVKFPGAWRPSIVRGLGFPRGSSGLLEGFRTTPKALAFQPLDSSLGWEEGKRHQPAESVLVPVLVSRRSGL